MGNKNISRRDALRILGIGAATATVGTFVKANPLRGNTFMDNLLSKIDNGEISIVTKRENKRNGDAISLLGFGCMRFPTIGMDRGAPIDIAKSEELVDYAYKHGINYFDTAYPYHDGTSEVVIGNALKKYPRESFFIADKMPGNRIESEEQIAAIFQEQLLKLKVDYIDYYLLHSVSSLDTYNRVFEEWGGYNYLALQKERGLIKNLGFSFHGDRALWDYVIDKHPWDFVQIQLNYIDWRKDAEYLYNSLSERNIPCIVMEPLLGGRLSTLSPGADKILKEYNPEMSVASWAFRFVGSLPNVLVVLSGMTYMEHLVDNVKTFTDFKPLTAVERNVLNRAIVEYQKFDRIGCTSCRYCMPCPFGVEIPTVFATYNRLVMEGNIPDKTEESVYEQKKSLFAKTFEEAFPSGGDAWDCVGCESCLPKCPQHLRIPDLMDVIKGELA